MRPLLVLAILLLGVCSAAPEPEYSVLTMASARRDEGSFSLLEIKSSTGKTDRLALFVPPQVQASPQSAGGSSEEYQFDAEQEADEHGDTRDAQGVSIDQLCTALLTSAQDNNLPVAFFANLIWQESRLRNDVVSPKGAQGIAQFMPKVAVESGLEDPFDPMQALPASARLLSGLRQQFGNLGFVAAAYNAGAHRVSQWLQRHRTLPRETQGYVRQITGRSVEQWKKTPPSDAALHFTRRLPCRDLPAFAELEQAQAQQPEIQTAAAETDVAEQPSPGRVLRRHFRHGFASRWRVHRPAAHEAVHTARAHHQHGGRREARHHNRRHKNA